ncbi:hypothetical protein HAX54_033733 [Datura stramonium]|uniref:Rhamnogalacturonan endolyase n=1 Tax=Datura stramonium TaxID=4076 RepID=A0ABS8SDM9_DATST|nr:hypothetical protein [Datura stramonium]
MQKMGRYKHESVHVLEVTMVALLFFVVADCHPHNGYWDIIWNNTGPQTTRKRFLGRNFEVIIDNGNQTEISFKRTWNVSQSTEPPLNIDKRFIMLRDTPGFYTYSIVERIEGWPISYIQNLRIVFKLQQDIFHYLAVSDERQRVMPTEVDRENGKVLDYKEAVLLTDPTNPDLKGEVDDKYFYASDNKDGKVYGWISNTNPSLGFWMINPSNEYRTGGPFRQDLTTHIGPTLLNVFVSTHYAGEDLAIKFQHGETWKKVIGPVFVYLNSDAAAKANPSILWNDAKKRGYQFWNKTDYNGNFIIENVIFGTYNLFRQYGLWKQYSVLYPENDLVYNVKTSNFFRDWFFAQVTRNIGNNTYKATTWKIIFSLANVENASNYTLQLALAAAHQAELQVRVNDGKARKPHFTTGYIGGSNAIARHGIHGLYWLYSIGIQGNFLVKGTNTIFLTQTIALTPFQGVMYDYIRFEGPHQ